MPKISQPETTVYTEQSWQSAKLFLQSSELGLHRPLTRRRVSPPSLVPGEGHTRWRERGWESPNSDEGTYTVVLFIYMYMYFMVYSMQEMWQVWSLRITLTKLTRVVPASGTGEGRGEGKEGRGEGVGGQPPELRLLISNTNSEQSLLDQKPNSLTYNPLWFLGIILRVLRFEVSVCTMFTLQTSC